MFESSSAENEYSDEPDPQATWHLPALLSFVVLALLALMVVPYQFTRHTAELRERMNQVAIPLFDLHYATMRTSDAEMSAVRGYVITGEDAFLERFQQLNPEMDRLAAEMERLASELDEPVAPHARRVHEAHGLWASASLELAEGSLTTAEYQTMLPEQQVRYDALIDENTQFRSSLVAATQTLRHQIQQAERRGRSISEVLSLLALLATGAVLWLGQRLFQARRRLAHRNREKARLLRITRILNEAEDLQSALEHITDSARSLTDAGSAHVEQVNFDRDEIEVVAVSGSSVPALGTQAPYPGSLTEKVLTTGEVEQTTVEALLQEQRPMAEPLSKACSSCQILVFPLLSEGMALGALLLNRNAPEAAFSEEEIRRTHLLVDLASLVLRRLYLFEESDRSRKALHETTDQLQVLNETLEEHVRQRTREVHRLAGELTLAEQRERHNIAQVLHDDLQQQLYGLRLSLELARRTAEEGSELRQDLKRAVVLTQEALDTTRNLSINLSPPVLEGEGLDAALEWLRTNMKERFDLDIDLQRRSALTALRSEMRVLLFQIVRELLFNVVKHAGSSRVTVALQEEAGLLKIEIIDRGAGFDIEKRGASVGIGLRRARERLALFNGTMDIASAPGKGTRVTLTVPVHHPR